MINMRVLEVELVFAIAALFCSVVEAGLPQITPAPILNERRTDSDAAFEGYTSDFGSCSSNTFD